MISLYIDTAIGMLRSYLILGSHEVLLWCACTAKGYVLRGGQTRKMRENSRSDADESYQWEAAKKIGESPSHEPINQLSIPASSSLHRSSRTWTETVPNVSHIDYHPDTSLMHDGLCIGRDLKGPKAEATQITCICNRYRLVSARISSYRVTVWVM
ncbi:hypothetical protein F5878DRAFT_431135 [Lentinula raphanica]|uniref:Uncharacterized protein n=1 Tax=Lentinula raphanica TaxID=153919 RepID=A0AA38UHI2_9AGAR|nr:hypothetical protein F5878DRAFT_431135 [Lentinula raphanica]